LADIDSIRQTHREAEGQQGHSEIDNRTEKRVERQTEIHTDR